MQPRIILLLAPSVLNQPRQAHFNNRFSDLAVLVLRPRGREVDRGDRPDVVMIPRASVELEVVLLLVLLVCEYVVRPSPLSDFPLRIDSLLNQSQYLQTGWVSSTNAMSHSTRSPS